jgi:hypothetical protein
MVVGGVYELPQYLAATSKRLFGDNRGQPADVTSAVGQKRRFDPLPATSGLPPIAEVPLPVNVPVSPENVSAHGVLHSDKGLSQYSELAMILRLDPFGKFQPEGSITHSYSICILS